MGWRKWAISLVVIVISTAVWLSYTDSGKLVSSKLVVFMVAPKSDFDPERVPEAPDYSDLRFWAEYPDRNNLAEMQKVPVFFMHQTSLRSFFSWNETIRFPESPERYAWTKIWQTVVFRECCAIFAPFYRQATLGAYMKIPEGLKARNLAYTDTLRAFDTFVQRDLHDRPFILAGHSQGAEHGLRLLKERIRGTALEKQLIVAYLIGYPIKQSYLEQEFPSIPPCREAAETSCVVAYSTFRRGYEASQFFGQQATEPGPSGYEQVQQGPVICVNPLSWKLDTELASEALHLGTPLFPGEEAITSAQCEGGGLFVKDLDKRLVVPLGGNYHLYDYILFINNISQNASLRAKSFLSTHVVPRK